MAMFFLQSLAGFLPPLDLSQWYGATSLAMITGAGKGVTLIKLDKKDYVMGAAVLAKDSDVLLATRESGTEYRVTTRKYERVGRGGKGHKLFQRGKLGGVVTPAPETPEALS